MPTTTPLVLIEKRNRTDTDETGTNAATTREKVTIPVKGMTCAACQARVQRALQAKPGVLDASVNLMLKSAVVTYDPTATSPMVLVEAIRETGYGCLLYTSDAADE